MLSSIGVTNRLLTTRSWPNSRATYPPWARAESTTRLPSSISCCISPCCGGGASESKMRGELTIAASCGAASGTLMTSMRNSELFGFESGDCRTHPGSSVGERTGAEPDT